MIAHLIHMRAQLGRSMPFPLCSFGRGGPVYMSTRFFFFIGSERRGPARNCDIHDGRLLLPASLDSFDRAVYMSRLILCAP